MPARFERRDDYGRGELTEGTLPGEPMIQFDRWMRDALDAGLPEANAAALATAGESGRPSSRMVLLKNYDDGGFVFATNYASRKAAELAANPHASLLFWWNVLERQVRAEGIVSPTGDAESDAIFAERPRGARLGAWASPQSRRLTGRDELVRAFEAAERRYPGEIPRPPHWGGFRLRPLAVEFWQGRPHRLHDRLVYRRQADDGWQLERLAP